MNRIRVKRVTRAWHSPGDYRWAVYRPDRKIPLSFHTWRGAMQHADWLVRRWSK